MKAEPTHALSVKANMMWNAAGSFTYLLCQWLITVLVVRLSTGYDAAGILALGMAVSNLITPIGNYKIRPFQVSDTKEEYSHGQYIALRIATTGIAGLLMIAYAVLTCPIESLAPILIYCLYSLGPIFSDVLQGVAQRFDRMDIVGKALAFRGVISLASFSLVLGLSNSLTSALTAMTLLTFAEIACYEIPRTRSIAGAISPDFTLSPMMSLVKTCFPAVVALFFASAVSSIPRQILGAEYGPELLGIYASVATPVLIVQMGVQWIYSPLLGSFATCFSSGNKTGFSKLFILVSAALFGIAILATLFFTFFGDPILQVVYGKAIPHANELLVPLVICTILTSFIWFTSDLLIVVRDMTGNFLAYLIAFIVCLVTVTPFLNIWQANGVSFSMIASYAAASLFSIFRLIRIVPTTSSPRENER